MISGSNTPAFLSQDTSSFPRPIFVGIAGGTGSGKSTVAHQLCQRLPKGSSALVDHDSYYKPLPHLSAEAIAAYNFDHPDALDSALLHQHLQDLAQLKSIKVPKYDFVRHVRHSTYRLVEPAPIILVEGILVLADNALRDCLDIKLFVDTDADIRLMRRIERDISHRGRSWQQIHDQYRNTVRPMHLQFVEPSKRWADVIIPEGGHNCIALDLIVGKLGQVALQSQPVANGNQEQVANRAQVPGQHAHCSASLSINADTTLVFP